MDDHSALIEWSDAWAAAIIANDAQRIASFMADDWVMVSETGISSKSEFVERVASGALTHSAMDRVSTARVRILGDTAIVTARVTNTAWFEGQRFDADEWTTDVVTRDGDRWVCVLSQITPATPG